MGWLKSDGIYSTFASDVESYVKTTGQGPRCPVCRKELKASFIFENAIRVGDEPMAMFENTHVCGAKLKIFND